MTDASFASLSPTLLARKGGAKPAMRRQQATAMGGSAAHNLEDLGWDDMGADDEVDTSHKADVFQLTPAKAGPAPEDQEEAGEEVISDKPAVVSQRENIAERLQTPLKTPMSAAVPANDPAPAPTVSAPVSAPAPAPAPAPAKPARPRRSAIARGKRAAFTLRLDAERHLKLRLACTASGRSAQQMVTDALDQLLGDMPELESLAAQLQKR